MNFVLDASVALSWCFAEEREGAEAISVLERLRENEAVVPALWALEVSNGLTVAQRRGRLTGAEVGRAAELLLSLPIIIEPQDRSRPFGPIQSLAQRHALSVYDASYLELAVRLGVPIASFDSALIASARSEGVTNYIPFANDTNL